MTEPELREAGRLLLDGIGQPIVQVWVSRWVVDKWLGVGRRQHSVYWATITRGLTNALFLWAHGQVAEAGTQLRRTVAVYDKWMALTGRPGPGVLAQSVDVGLRFLAEWQRLQLVRRGGVG